MALTGRDIEIAVAARFRKDEAPEILRLLEAYQGHEQERVRMCILILSGSDLHKIKHNIKQAIDDYRDVLYWADPDNELG